MTATLALETVAAPAAPVRVVLCPYCRTRPMPGLLARSCDTAACVSADIAADSRYERGDDW